jgi:hypothetical protein
MITSLDISGCTALGRILCSYNRIDSLDVSDCTSLDLLNCYSNKLSNLTLSSNLKNLDCSANQLTSLDISKSTALEVLQLNFNKDLREVCVWTMPFPPSGVEVETVGSLNVEFKDCIVGIEGIGKNELKMHPNPTNSILTLEMGISDQYHVEITSMNGQFISSIRVEGTTHHIDLSSYQKGVYFITIRSKDFVTTKKIIKY